jgi:parallel beta-helix repeat protein
MHMYKNNVTWFISRKVRRPLPIFLATLIVIASFLLGFQLLGHDLGLGMIQAYAGANIQALACNGDLNQDARIDQEDLTLMANAILSGTPGALCADLNDDASVNALDLQLLINRILHPQTGNVYYVSTSGRDSNEGSIDSPWASLDHAIEIAQAGDTIMMRGGEYTTNEVWIRGDRGMGGSNGQYLTIKSYPGEIASVGGSRWMDLEADFVRIEGLHFRMPYSLDVGGEGNQIVNNTFYGPQPDYAAIMCGGTDNLIQGNRVEITGGGSTLDHGIYLLSSTGITIRGNYISGFYGYGIHMYDEDKGDHRPKPYEDILIEGNIVVGSPNRSGMILGAHDSTVSIDNVVIRNNVVHNNADAGILIKYEPISNVQIYNNTIYGNASGITILTAIDHLEIVNNILASNRGGHIEISGNLANASITHNLYDQPDSVGSGVSDSHPIFANPSFVDASSGDFHLQAGSPAIDAGLDIGMPYNGIAPDLGAYEYGQ